MWMTIATAAKALWASSYVKLMTVGIFFVPLLDKCTNTTNN